MAPKTTLNAKNLEALGAERLALLLIEISTGSAASKRRLRLELAGAQSAAEVSREVAKRLGSIDRSRTVIGWRKIKAVRADLETQRTTIVGSLGAQEPDEAVELLFRFLDLAASILARCNTASDPLIACFQAACVDLGTIAQTTSIKQRQRLPAQLLSLLKRNDEGQYDPLIRELAPALGDEGLRQLQSLLRDWLKEAMDPPGERGPAGATLDDASYEDRIIARHQCDAAQAALEQVADALGDVDAYVAQQSQEDMSVPTVGAEIANRLLKAGRAEEALTALDRAEPKGLRKIYAFQWQEARCDVLDALGRHQEAQELRLSSFRQSLSPAPLRAYLKRLPDFNDIEAEEEALDFVGRSADVHAALLFLVEWPAPARAVEMTIRRAAEIDGDHYELLTDAAGALQDKYPLAATILLRAMINFALDQGRASRYRHAARHLVECANLAAHIADFSPFPDHRAYAAKLQANHGKKHGFWRAIR